MIMKVLLVLILLTCIVSAGRVRFGTEKPGFVKLGTFRKNTIFLSYDLSNAKFFLDGTYSDGTSYKKAYYLSSHFKAHWNVALATCHAYGMEMLSLESSDEESSFLTVCTLWRTLFDRFTHIGALTTVEKSRTEWFWVNSGNKISFPISFSSGEPNSEDNNEMCLTMDKRSGLFQYNDITCDGGMTAKFVCQDYEETIAITTPRTYRY